MRLTVEQVENGYLIVHETNQFRKVYIVQSAEAVVDFVKQVVNPSSVLAPSKEIAVVK
jgi:hypothetical protein